MLETAKGFLKTCPSEMYYIITQPSLSSAELRAYQPHLRTALLNPSVKTQISVSEVPGLTVGDGDELVKFLGKECGAKMAKAFGVKDVAKELEGNMAEETKSVVVRGEWPVASSVRQERKELAEDAGMFISHVALPLPNLQPQYQDLTRTKPMTRKL